MDFSKLDTSKGSETGAVLELLSPVDETVLRDEKTGEAVSITLIGPDSKEFMRVSQKTSEKRLQKRFGGKGKAKISLAELQEDNLELLVACTKSWKHIVVEGKELTCSEESARMLYTKFPWVREQVDAFINDRSNFLGE